MSDQLKRIFKNKSPTDILSINNTLRAKNDSESTSQHAIDEKTDKFKKSLQYDEIVATCNIDHPTKFQVMLNSLQTINQALTLSPTDRTLLLVRSYIQFYLHNFYEALCDIDAVIELERASSGEEEPNATDLLHKGRCHACLSMFKEAIADFTRVIDLDDELFDAYFFRGKCAYLIGDTSQAFLDFQKLIML